MSTDTVPPNNNTNAEMYTRNRRGSITQAALTNLFQRGNSVPNSNGFPNQSSGPVDTSRRRLSVTTLGLSGTSPTNTSFIRRGSMSTNSNNSDSIDESAIEDDDMYSKTAPTTPFVRRMSFGTSNMRSIRPNGSPGNGNSPSSPPTSQNGRSVPSGRKASLVGSPSQGPSLAAALSAGRRPSLASSVTQTSRVSTGPSSLDLVPRVPSSVLLGLPSRSPPPPHPGAPFTTARNLFLRCRSLLSRLLLSSSRRDSLKDQSLMPFRRES